VLIGNDSELNSFYTSSKLTMRLKYAPAKKTAEEVKKIAEFFNNLSHSRPRDESSMDWSVDVPEVQSSPVLCISPAGEHMHLPHVLRTESSNSSIKFTNGRLSFSLFYFSFLFSFCFIFLFFYF